MIHATRWSSEIREEKILYCVLKKQLPRHQFSALVCVGPHDDKHRQISQLLCGYTASCVAH